MASDARPRTLVLPRSELDRIKGTTELGSRQLDLEFLERRLRAERRAATERAGNLLESTYEKQLGAERETFRRRAEAARRREVLEAGAAREARQGAAAAEAQRERRLHFWARDGVKQLHSALQMAEVLRERGAQLEFNSCTREQAARREQAVRAAELVRAEQTRQREREERRRREGDKAALGETLRRQMQQHEARQREEVAAGLRERQEELRLFRELCEERERHKAEEESKRAKFLRDFLEAAQAERDEVKKRAEADRLEKRVCGLYVDFRDRITRKLEALRRTALQESISRKELKSSKVLFSDEEKLRNEREWLVKTEAERIERERVESAKRGALEHEVRQRALELRAHQTRRAEEQRAARQRVDHEAVAARHQHEHVTRTFAELQRREKVEQQARNARGYAEQRELRRLEEWQERAHERAADERQQRLWQLEDRQFLDYAGQVLREAEVIGRPSGPLRKTLESYKKKFGIERKPFVKPSMRSQLDIGVDAMRDADYI